MQSSASRHTEPFTRSSFPRPSFPRSLTSFIGRENEIREITDLLLAPDCRLLTLLGPGGMGKTRLAIQAATRAATEFAHDAHFVNLQPMPTPAARHCRRCRPAAQRANPTRYPPVHLSATKRDAAGAGQF